MTKRGPLVLVVVLTLFSPSATWDAAGAPAAGDPEPNVTKGPVGEKANPIDEPNWAALSDEIHEADLRKLADMPGLETLSLSRSQVSFLFLVGSLNHGARAGKEDDCEDRDQPASDRVHWHCSLLCEAGVPASRPPLPSGSEQRPTAACPELRQGAGRGRPPSSEDASAATRRRNCSLRRFRREHLRGLRDLCGEMFVPSRTRLRRLICGGVLRYSVTL